MADHNARPVAFTDEGFRDGPQSLWGSRMSTETMVDIAAEVDAVGYEKSVVVSGATFEAAVQYLHEDPWERLDAVTALMPNTPSVAQIRGRTLFGWKQFPDDVVELFIKTLVKHGIDWFLVYDALNDMRLIEQHVRVAESVGVPVTVPICYSISPVHTEEYFLDVIGQAAKMNAAGVSIIDASGLMSPETARTLIGAAQNSLKGSATRLEMNIHDLTGRSLECCVQAIEMGVDALAVTPRAVSYGKSLPAVGDVMAAADRSGRPVSLDRNGLSRVEDFFTWAAHLQKQEIPQSRKLTDADLDSFISHQIPGGMMSNLTSQLRDLGIEDRLPEILEEAARVREELGFPVMVTPCSQMVGVQATLNVVGNERYVSAPTEVKNYLAGVYGTPAGKVDENVIDKILGDAPMIDPYKSLEEPYLPGFKAENGSFSSDEDLLLAVMYSKQTLATFRENTKPVRTTPRRAETALVSAILDRYSPSRMRLAL